MFGVEAAGLWSFWDLLFLGPIIFGTYYFWEGVSAQMSKDSLRSLFPFLAGMKLVEILAALPPAKRLLESGPLARLLLWGPLPELLRAYRDYRIDGLVWLGLMAIFFVYFRDRIRVSSQPPPVAVDRSRKRPRSISVGKPRPAGSDTGSRESEPRSGSWPASQPLSVRPRRRSNLGSTLVLLTAPLLFGLALYDFGTSPERLAWVRSWMEQLPGEAAGLPWLWMAVAVVGLFFFGIVVRAVWLRFRWGVPGRWFGEAINPGDQLRSQKLLAAGRTAAAARIWFERGADLRGLRILHVADRQKEMGDYYLQKGQRRRALKAFLRAGGEGAFQAAEIYEKMGQNERAAFFFRKAGEFAKGGKRFQEAARSFLRCGRKDQAAEALELGLKLMVARGEDSSFPKFKATAARAAALHKELGQPNKAAVIYLLGGFHREAGDLFQEQGLMEEAAQTYAEGGLSREAAAAYERVGFVSEAAEFRAKQFLESGDRAAAARELERAGKPVEAAEIWIGLDCADEAMRLLELAGEHRRAVDLALQAGDSGRAAGILEADGRYTEAAAQYQISRDLAAAARCYEAAGDLLEAARLCQEAGRPKEALRLLKTISPEDDGFQASLELAATAHRSAGDLTEAVSCYQRLLAERVPGPENTPPCYELATLLEEIGEPALAATYYKKVIHWDYAYKDAVQRLRNLQEVTAALASKESTPDAARVSMPGLSESASAVAGERYRLEREIGRGGMGVVYLAKDLTLDRLVAFKLLPADMPDFHDGLRAFRREARLAAKLNHPNIVAVYDFGSSGKNAYIVMEYVEGETLDWFIKRRQTVIRRYFKAIFRQIGAGLQDAHNEGLIHRDIKPQNIMLSKRSQVKIMDFGIAKLASSSTRTSVIKGTPLYMAPEQIMGNPVDHRADIYSLGIVIYQAATGGKVPFTGDSVIGGHMFQEPAPPSQFDASISLALDRLILRCIAKNPEERPQTVAALSQELEAMDAPFLE